MKKCAKMRQNLFVLTTREGGCEVMGARSFFPALKFTVFKIEAMSVRLVLSVLRFGYFWNYKFNFSILFLNSVFLD